MKRIFSLRVIITFAVLLLSMSLYSCSENPVVPPVEEPYQFDSARFDWEIDTLTGYGILDHCIYAEDTNNVFLLNIFQEYLLNIKDDQKIYYYFNDFYTACLNGVGNEIYIGGSRINNNGQNVPHIRKFNNGSFHDIYFPESDTIQHDFVKYIYINQFSEIWVITLYFFIKYDGSDFTFYRIPLPENSILFLGQILEDQNNSLKAFGWESKWEGNLKKFYSYIFEFKTNNWERIWQNTCDPSTENMIRMNVFNNRIITAEGNKIFEYNGSDFVNVVSLNNIDYMGGILGNSYNDFLFFVYINGMGRGVMHWNGIIKSLEFPYGSFEAVSYKFNKDKFWIILNSLEINQILICKGYRKN